MIKVYKKKPIEIEAIQLTKNNIYKVYTFIYGKPNLDSAILQEKWYDYENVVKNEGLRLKTLESHNETQIANIGDWIIKGVANEFYPCKPEIFEKTYEEVE